MVIFVQLTYSYTSVKGAPVNYSGKSSCDERMYQPYMEHQETTLVILCVMNAHTNLIWSISKLL